MQKKSTKHVSMHKLRKVLWWAALSHHETINKHIKLYREVLISGVIKCYTLLVATSNTTVT